MTDIVDRIIQYAPSEIDRFHADMERRNSLDDDKINKILQDVFTKIDVDRLTPSLSFRWHDIKNRI